MNNRRKVALVLCVVLAMAIVGIGARGILQLLSSVGEDTNFAVESLRWTMFGAIGSWAGSVFGAIALIISLLALWLPQRVKIKVSMSTGCLLSQMPGADKTDAYIITVKNVGMKSITVNNVYLHFGDEKNGDIFVGVLNQGTILEMFTPTFPKRLEQGESFEYYLIKSKLDIALAHYEEKTSKNTPLSIRVDEVTKGSRYYKTKWTLATFIDSTNKK